MTRTIMCGAILMLLAPFLLWLGFTQPLWHLMALILLMTMGAGLWKVVSRAVTQRRASQTIPQ